MSEKKTNRRDFLFTATYAVGAVGVGATVWPMVDQMNPDASVKALASTEVDVIITSGGASAGQEDHMSAILTKNDSLSVWRIAVKPGRPLVLAVYNGRPVFGLPGNPVAAGTCAMVFAKPALNIFSGREWLEPLSFQLPANFSKSKKAGRREFLRARIRNGKVDVFQSEGSGRVSGLSWAEGFVDLPEHELSVSPDDIVKYIPFSSYMD